MAAPSTDLVSRIVELKEEFQHIANQHPWICLATPSLREEGAAFHVGEKAPGPALLFGVVLPPDNARRVVVDYVNQLTFKAISLLDGVLEHDSKIPTDIQQEMREQSSFSGHRWLRWLRYAACFQHVLRYENYPQVAAAALWELKEHCRLGEVSTQTDGEEGWPATPKTASANPSVRPDEKLTDTERTILKLCKKKAMKGETIAYHKDVSLSPEHIRRVLARLVKEGRLRNDSSGYRTVKPKRAT